MNKYKSYCFIAMLFSCFLLYGKADKDPFLPWFNGPLVATGGTNIAPGHLDIEPFFNVYSNYGTYQNNWSLDYTSNLYQLEPQLFVEFGLNHFVDIELFQSSTHNARNGAQSTRFDDLFIGIGLQFLREERGTWKPNIRLLPNVTVPLGKYKNGNPEKNGTDITGQGSWVIGPILVFSKTYYPSEDHPIRFNLNLDYAWSSTVTVEGINTYGGDPTTRGVVKPGNTFLTNFSLEAALTQRWGLIVENIYSYTSPDKFTGTTNAAVGSGVQHLFQMVPEIEYSFTPNSGFIAGIWYTIAGKNESAFVALTMAYNYLY